MNLISIDEVRIDYMNEDNYTPFYQYELVEKAPEDRVFTPSIPGIYRLEITRHRNNDTKVGYSIDYRVTKLPEIPVIVNEGDKQMNLSDVLAEKDKFTIELADYTADSFNVIIKRDHNNHNGDFVVRTVNVTKPVNGIIEINPNTFMSAINAHNDEYGDELGLNGRYYAVIESVLNGKASDPVSTEESLVWIIVED